MTHLRTALLYASSEVTAYLERQCGIREPAHAKLSFVLSERVGAKVGLIAQGDSVGYLARLDHEFARDDISRSFDMDPIYRIDPPIPLAELQTTLAPNQRLPFMRGG